MMSAVQSVCCTIFVLVLVLLLIPSMLSSRPYLVAGKLIGAFGTFALEGLLIICLVLPKLELDSVVSKEERSTVVASCTVSRNSLIQSDGFVEGESRSDL